MVDKKEREALAAQFERHAEEEGRILAEYRILLEKLGEGPANFLINLILTEEELHHLLLKTTAKWLREAPATKASPATEGVRSDLLGRTQQLKKHELETIESCKSQQSGLSGPDNDLIASVLEVMALDSEKHHRLLLTVEKMLKA